MDKVLLQLSIDNLMRDLCNSESFLKKVALWYNKGVFSVEK